MDRTIAVANEKGGTSKTTTAVNLSAALARCGQRVLLVDLDAQGSASAYLGCASDGRGLLEVLGGSREILELVQPSASGVDVVPSGHLMAGAQSVLASQIGSELILRGALETLPADRWDMLILDCPPSLGLVSVSALAAVREVLIPVHTQSLPLAGVAQFVRTLQQVRVRGLNPALALTGVLACCTDATRLSRDVEAALRESFGARVFTSTVRRNTQVAESFGHARPIGDYAPRSTGAADFEALAAELLARAPAAVAA